MKVDLDSRTLFVKQVADHKEAVCSILECDTKNKMENTLLDRCIISTKMLANSASLLNLDDWENFILDS